MYVSGSGTCRITCIPGIECKAQYTWVVSSHTWVTSGGASTGILEGTFGRDGPLLLRAIAKRQTASQAPELEYDELRNLVPFLPRATRGQPYAAGLKRGATRIAHETAGRYISICMLVFAYNMPICQLPMYVHIYLYRNFPYELLNAIDVWQPAYGTPHAPTSTVYTSRSRARTVHTIAGMHVFSVDPQTKQSLR